MVNRVFDLQYSRFAAVLQFLLFIIITILLYQLLILPIWLLCLFLMSLAWFVFQKKPQITRFEYLDDQLWSLCFSDVTRPIQQRKIHHVIDHQCYIVVYFADVQHQSCIIWWDQLSLLQWKNLKLLAKLA